MLTRRPYASSFSGIESEVWPSTGEIDSDTASLAAQISALGQDFYSVNAPSDAFQNAWNAFVTDFLNWKSTGYYWNPGRRDQLLTYRQRFNQLLQQFNSFGGTTAVAPAQHDQPTPDSLDKLLSGVKWLGLGIVAVGVLKLVSDSGLLRKRS